MKVILNKCYGGFDVSHKGYELYAKKKGISLYVYDKNYGTGDYRKLSRAINDNFGVRYCTKDFGDYLKPTKEGWKFQLCLDDRHREDPTLIEVVEELGEEASGRLGKLVVVEIPDGMKYVIDNYNGVETLHEDVPTW